MEAALEVLDHMLCHLCADLCWLAVLPFRLLRRLCRAVGPLALTLFILFCASVGSPLLIYGAARVAVIAVKLVLTALVGLFTGAPVENTLKFAGALLQDVFGGLGSALVDFIAAFFNAAGLDFIGTFIKILHRGFCPVYQMIHNIIMIICLRPLGVNLPLLDMCCEGCHIPNSVIVGSVLGAMILVWSVRRLWRGGASHISALQGRTLRGVLDEIAAVGETLPPEAQTHYVGQADALLKAVRRERDLSSR